MKFLILVFAVMGSAVGESNLPCYVTENDYVNIDYIVSDVTMVRACSNCFLDKGPCPSVAQSFKDLIQDAVIRTCDRCNLPQKQVFGKFILALKAYLPCEYEAFRQKYDPQNIFFDALEAELSKYWNYTTRATPPLF